MPDKRTIHGKMKEIYKDFRVLPSINDGTYTDKANARRNMEVVKLKSLKTACLPSLPWIMQSKADSLDRMSFRKPEVLFKRQMTNISVVSKQIMLQGIENKYRNLDSKRFDLQPRDFSLEQAHKIEKLRFHQTLLGGDPVIMANDAGYIQRIENKLEIEGEKIDLKRSNWLVENELRRERELRYYETVKTPPLDPLRKMDVRLISPVYPLHQQSCISHAELSEISSSLTPDSWESTKLPILDDKGRKYIYLATQRHKSRGLSSLLPYSRHPNSKNGPESLGNGHSSEPDGNSNDADDKRKSKLAEKAPGASGCCRGRK